MLCIFPGKERQGLFITVMQDCEMDRNRHKDLSTHTKFAIDEFMEH